MMSHHAAGHSEEPASALMPDYARDSNFDDTVPSEDYRPQAPYIA